MKGKVLLSLWGTSFYTIFSNMSPNLTSYLIQHRSPNELELTCLNQKLREEIGNGYYIPRPYLYLVQN